MKNNFKKIYIISQTESELTQRGKRHPNLAEYLAKNRNNVNYFSSNFYHAEKRHFSKKEISVTKEKLKYNLEIINSLGYYKNTSFKRILSNLIFSIKTYFILKKKIQSGDTLIVSSRPVEILYFISQLKKRKKFKVVLDIRDVWPDAFNIKNKIFKFGFDIYCNLFLKESIKNFDCYVHTCPSFVKWLNRYAPNSNSAFIPLGYDPKRFSDKQEIRRRKNIIKIVYIGLLQYQIDILPFIKAILNNPVFELTIVGDNGDGERFSQIMNYIKANNILNVQIKGKVPQNKVNQILNNFDIGLLPMNAEFVFPNKLFDYIASSLPIFSLGKNDATDFVLKNEIGWVSSFDEKEIREVLLGIVTSKSDNIYRCSENINKIRKDYSREKLFKKFTQLI